MKQAEQLLDDLRREIDEIDDALHDLLIRRTEVVQRIAALKGANGLTALRPAREASILRRLVARHKGPFPISTLVSVWREIMSALVGIQAPFAVAVSMPKRGAGYLELARYQFGSYTPVTAYRSAAQVFNAVIEGRATVGVLPLPQDDGQTPWWLALTVGENPPRIIGRLPFGASPPNDGNEQVEAFVIAHIAQEPTGADRSLFAIETSEISRARLKSEMDAVKLPAVTIVSWHGPKSSGESTHLVEIDDFVGEGDKRLDALQKRLGPDLARRIVPVGGYAIPFGAAAGPSSSEA